MEPIIDLDYFDGVDAKAQVIQARVVRGQLWLKTSSGLRSYPIAQVQWPERTQGGSRSAQLPDGGSVYTHDASLWDPWVERYVPVARASWVVRLQQSWQGSLAAALALLTFCCLAYFYGIPWAAKLVVTLTPQSVDQSVGDLALQQLRRSWLQASKIDPTEQRQINLALAEAMQAAYPRGNGPTYELHFQSGTIGPNAFALPGGHIVITDDLVQLSHKAGAEGPTMLVAILAHEMGHLRQRHGMRMLVQTGALGMITSTLVGDFSSVMAALPALLGQADYSRTAEREADAESIRIMLAWGRSPAVMNRFFELVRQQHPQIDPNMLSIAFASHPADQERIARFTAAANQAR